MVRLTEGDGEGAAGADHGVDSGTAVRPGHQPQAGLGRHGRGVEERFAHGHVAVVGHHGQKEALSTGTEGEEEELRGTTLNGDGALIAPQGLQQLRDDNGGVANVQEGEVAEEKVHGSLEARVTLNQRHHAQVASQGDEIKEQKHKEETRLQLGPQLEPQQNEFCYRGAVPCHEASAAP